MPENKDFALRIETIDECLRNPYKKWTLQSLADAVNQKLADRYGKKSARRTIQADLKYMREEKNAPVKRYKQDGITYFTYADLSFSLKNIPIDPEEISLLQDAINILTQINDFKITAEVQAIINKLQNTVATNISRQPCYIQFEKHTVATGVSFIDPLFAAIKEMSALRISYQPFQSPEPVKSVYHPYLLKEYRNRWFVLCRKESDVKITTLALDRIKEIKNSNKPFIENDLFHPEDYFNYVIGVSVPEHSLPEKIVIRISKAQVPYVLSKPIHRTQEVLETHKSGDIIVCVFLTINFELKATLMSYGPEIEIIAPTSLRLSLKGMFNTGTTLYSNEYSND